MTKHFRSGVFTSIILTIPVLALPVTTVMLSGKVFALNAVPVSSPVTQPNPTYTVTPTPTPVTPPNPTYTVTPTPTQIPVTPPNPTYTVTPTPTPMPVTPPNPNSSPVIVTNKLQTARVGRSYSVTVKGTDKNRSDALSMRITGLPAGLVQGPCAYKIGFFSTSLVCRISGKPLSVGIYTVRVELTDYVNQPVVKYLKLQVSR